MWSDVLCDMSTGWDWIVRDYTYEDEGGENTNDVVYHDIKLRFIHGNNIETNDRFGRHDEAIYNAVVPASELEDDALTPRIGTTFLRKNGITYRVVGIDDWTDYLHINVYYLTLKKDELAD